MLWCDKTCPNTWTRVMPDVIIILITVKFPINESPYHAWPVPIGLQ
jgi:hypothetical protein